MLNLGRNDVFDALLEYPEFGVAMVQDLALRHHTLTERVIELETAVGVTSRPSGRTHQRGGHRTLGAGSTPTQTSWLVAAGRTPGCETVALGSIAR